MIKIPKMKVLKNGTESMLDFEYKFTLRDFDNMCEKADMFGKIFSIVDGVFSA